MSIKCFPHFNHLLHKNCVRYRHVFCFLFFKFCLNPESSFLSLICVSQHWELFVGQRISKQYLISCPVLSNIPLVAVGKAILYLCLQSFSIRSWGTEHFDISIPLSHLEEKKNSRGIMSGECVSHGVVAIPPQFVSWYHKRHWAFSFKDAILILMIAMLSLQKKNKDQPT